MLGYYSLVVYRVWSAAMREWRQKDQMKTMLVSLWLPASSLSRGKEEYFLVHSLQGSSTEPTYKVLYFNNY